MCLHIIKINDLEIIFMLQAFLIFALHGMRNTQVIAYLTNEEEICLLLHS